MDTLSHKEINPQKAYIKWICKCMYYIGMGDCWYETVHIPRGIVYTTWAVVSNLYVSIIVLNELLAHFRTDLNEKEKNDLFQFSIAHPLVYFKILTLYYKRSQIIVVFERLLEGNRSIFFSAEIDRAAARQSKIYSLLLMVSLYATLVATTMDAVRVHINEGIPIRTEVVLYPTRSDSGLFVNILRGLVEFHWYHMMAMMLAVDIFVSCSLVLVGFKFKTLKLYCEKMRKKVIENRENKSRVELEKDFKNDFVTAIKMHEDALWCALNVQSSMGVIYSITLLESVGLLVMCLVKLVVAERNLSYLLANLAYVVCLLVIAGSYMMAAGDITHEAALVPTSFYSCGWELTRARSDFRVLAVVAIQRGQVPVRMTAFGMIELSYANFISLLRSSYSFFAVMY